MSMISMTNDYTKATTFVRPLLGWANSFFTNSYINCYIELKPDHKIFLVFHKLEGRVDDATVECFQQMQQHPLFDGIKETQDKIVFEFHADPDMAYDMDQFARGKYSKMSDGAKQLILFGQASLSNVAPLSRVLYPSAEDRKTLSEQLGEELPADVEIMSCPDLAAEMYASQNIQ